MNWMQFDRALDEWSAEEKRLAKSAEAKEDERAQSMALMRASMYGRTLKPLARKAGALTDCAYRMEQRAQAAKRNGDYDEEEKCVQRRDCAQRAQVLWIEMEEST